MPPRKKYPQRVNAAVLWTQGPLHPQVQRILTEGEGQAQKAVGVRLADGRVFRGKAVVSNATRWDTFEKLMQEEQLPPSEKAFRDRYKKSPSFLSIHMGVKAAALPSGKCSAFKDSPEQSSAKVPGISCIGSVLQTLQAPEDLQNLA